MWSVLNPRPLGNTPLRRITLFALAILMALFTAITINSASVQAQTTTEIDAMATWSGDNLQYATVSLEKRNRPRPDNPDYPNLAGTPCETKENLYYSGISESPSTPDVYWIYVICFDGSDRTQPIDATMLNYSLPKDSEDVRGGAFNRVSSLDIQIAPEGTDPLGNPADGASEPTSNCTGEGTQGIGWIVCPLTRWLAAGMDALFDILQSFLRVAPLSTDTNGPMFSMWGIMRNLANLMFIIGFLIIIYSQITSYGLSNYGLKRLLPRLILAAVLVNISYWIAAVAVDLSNILGVSLYDFLINTGRQIQNTTSSGVSSDQITWSSIAGSVLTGSVAALGIASLTASVVASAGASLWFLLVALMGVMVSALVAIIVLAARQALITILIVISPLAFVAYLLPSTEKYFDRWRGLFTTMLLLYPLVSIVFGGAQLAGLVIIYGALENPGGPNFFNLLILGMIVQVAPVIITPLLIRLGGSLLGRIAGIVNDPNKGVIDRTRKFAQTRHDMTKNRQLWDWDANNKRYRNRNPLAVTGRWNALREENNAAKLKSWQSGLHAAYEQSPRAHDTYTQKAINEMRQKSGEEEAKAHFDRSVRNVASMRSLYLEQRQKSDEAATENKVISTLYEGIKADPSSLATNGEELAIGRRALRYHVTARALDYRGDSAKNIQEAESNNAVINNEMTINGRTIREFAGFSEIDPLGASRMASVAQQKEAEAYQKRVAAPQAAQNKVEATQEDLLNIVYGITPTSGFAEGIRDHADFVEGRAGAIRNIGDSSPVKDIHALIKSDRLNLTESATGDDITLRSEVAGVGKKGRTIYLSKTISSFIAEGKIDSSLRGEALMNKLVLDTANSGAFSVTGLAQSIDRDDIDVLAKYIDRASRGEVAALQANTIEQLRRDLNTVVTDARFSSSLDKRRKEVGALWDQVYGVGTRPPKLRE